MLYFVMFASYLAMYAVIQLGFFERNKWIVWIGILGFCYPLGELLQRIPQLPEWIRFHLSDLGFVPFATAGFVLGGFFIYGPRNIQTRYKAGVVTTICSYWIAIAVEFLQSGIGDADRIDLVLFMVGTFLMLTLLKKAFPKSIPSVHEDSPAPLPSRAERRKHLQRKSRKKLLESSPIKK